MPTQEQTESLPPSDAGAILDADELTPGARVVYPNQGVCRVVGRQAREIAGHRLEFVSLVREEDNASILVPVTKVPAIGLRKVADTGELADVFDLLASSFDDPELDWKVRHKHHADLLAAGGVLGVAEVLKALQGLGNLRPLPQKERERYDQARHLLVNELSVALGVPPATAEDYIDLALIPPPGVIRPAAKPRRLAPIPVRPQRPRPKPLRRADEFDEELGVEELDEEIDLGEEPELEEEPLEEEAAEEEPVEEEIEEEPPAKQPRKTAAKKPAAKSATRPARKAAEKPAAKKKAEAAAGAGEADQAEERPKKASRSRKAAASAAPEAEAAAGTGEADQAEEKPKKASRSRKAAASAAPEAEAAAGAAAEKPKRASRKRKTAAEEPAGEAAPAPKKSTRTRKSE